MKLTSENSKQVEALVKSIKSSYDTKIVKIKASSGKAAAEIEEITKQVAQANEKTKAAEKKQKKAESELASANKMVLQKITENSTLT